MQSVLGTLIVAKEGPPPPVVNKDEAATRKHAPQVAQPFDHWLHKQLHEMYDAVAKEPLPDDILRLIDDDAATDRKPTSGDDKAREEK